MNAAEVDISPEALSMLLQERDPLAKPIYYSVFPILSRDKSRLGPAKINMSEDGSLMMNYFNKAIETPGVVGVRISVQGTQNPYDTKSKTNYDFMEGSDYDEKGDGVRIINLDLNDAKRNGFSSVPNHDLQMMEARHQWEMVETGLNQTVEDLKRQINTEERANKERCEFYERMLKEKVALIESLEATIEAQQDVIDAKNEVIKELGEKQGAGLGQFITPQVVSGGMAGLMALLQTGDPKVVMQAIGGAMSGGLAEEQHEEPETEPRKSTHSFTPKEHE